MVEQPPDLNDVAVFVRVASEMSFTRAAQKLGLPKSSVSRAVARLESALGASLLHRTTRSLRLTDVGAAYYERAQEALAALDDAGRTVSTEQRAPRGTLRVTAPNDLAHPMGAMIARFAELHPKLRVDVELSNRRVDLVAEGYDIALRAGPMRDSSLIARKLLESSLVAAASPSYLAKRGTPGTPDDLALHECVLFRPERGVAVWALSGPEGARKVRVAGRVSGDDFSFVHAAVLFGGGVGLLPRFSCEAELASGKLVHVLPAFTARGGALHLVYPVADPPEKVVVFRDFVVDWFAKAAKNPGCGVSRDAD